MDSKAGNNTTEVEIDIKDLEASIDTNLSLSNPLNSHPPQKKEIKKMEKSNSKATIVDGKEIKSQIWSTVSNHLQVQSTAISKVRLYNANPTINQSINGTGCSLDPTSFILSDDDLDRLVSLIATSDFVPAKDPVTIAAAFGDLDQEASISPLILKSLVDVARVVDSDPDLAIKSLIQIRDQALDLNDRTEQVAFYFSEALIQWLKSNGVKIKEKFGSCSWLLGLSTEDFSLCYNSLDDACLYFKFVGKSSRSDKETSDIRIFTFPSSEVYKAVPIRDEIIRGLLNADVIGFPTFDYARHFPSCCSRILGLDHELKHGSIGIDYYGRTVKIKILLVGVHIGRLQYVMNSLTTVAKIREIEHKFKGMRVFLGVDYMEAFKGVSLKLQALELLMQRNQELIGKLVIVQIANPARSIRKGVSEARTEVMSIVERINITYGSPEYEPVFIDHLIPLYEKVAYYVADDCCIVNALREGMNLLKLHPKWQGRAVLVQIANPGRRKRRDLDEIRAMIVENVKRINTQFGNPDYCPVVFGDPISMVERITYYTIASCVVVTPVREGMNLTPYECIVCRQGINNWSEFDGPRKRMAQVSEDVREDDIRAQRFGMVVLEDAMGVNIFGNEIEKEIIGDEGTTFLSKHPSAEDGKKQNTASSQRTQRRLMPQLFCSWKDRPPDELIYHRTHEDSWKDRPPDEAILGRLLEYRAKVSIFRSRGEIELKGEVFDACGIVVNRLCGPVIVGLLRNK